MERKKIKEKVILAFSGGLDTSVILKWLVEDGYDVIAFIANVGQKEDFTVLKEKALKIGAKKVYVEDIRKEFVTDFIFPALRASAIYEGRYLMGTSLARPLIAKKQIEIALKEKATAVAHGATGKGNDQVRFEFTYYILTPKMKIIAPWKDEEFLRTFRGRIDEIEYAKKYNIPIKLTTDKPWSCDDNIMHISYEAGELEDPAKEPKDTMFNMTVSPKDAPNEETKIEIEFEKGNPVKVRNLKDNTIKDDPVEIFEYLNKIGGKNGIGREDLVENRFIGIKSRGVYETPAGTILHKAHRDLEGITMDREVMHLRDMLIPKFAEIIYYGLWFSPEMEVLRTFFDKTQEYVSGKVKLSLYKGNVTILGRESRYSLYNQTLSSMDVLGGYNPKDATGFIKINAIRLMNYALRKAKSNK